MRFLLGLIIFPIAAFAATPVALPRFQTLGVINGLPSRMVYSIAQDHDGFIWVGTHDGLARYDGVGFQTWRHDPANPQSLASNDTAAVFIDQNNQVWCGGEASGLNHLNQKTGQFSHYRHTQDDPKSLSSDDVWAITQDANGAIWVGTYLGGLNRLEANGTFTHYLHDENNAESISSNIILTLLSDARGRLWIGTHRGLDVLDEAHRIRHIPLFEEGAPSSVYAFKEDEKNGMYVGTSHGIVYVDANLQSSAFANKATEAHKIVALELEKNGELWAGTNDGLLHIQSDAAMRHFNTNEGLPGSLPGKQIMDILRDRENGLWFAFSDSGIARIPPRGKLFATYPYMPGNNASLSHAEIRGIGAEENGMIWVVSGKDGIDQIDPLTGHIERHGAWLDEKSLALWSIFPEKSDRLWIGLNGKIKIFDRNNNSLTEVNGIPPGTVDSILPAPDGAIWANSRGGGIVRIDPRTRAVQQYTPSQHSLSDADVSRLVLDRQGMPWVSTASGVERYDPTQERFLTVAEAPHEAVHTLTFAPDGSLWLHRLGALEHYTVHDNGLQLVGRLDASAGWPALIASSMVVARDNNLWVTTPRGLWRVDGNTYALRQFNVDDGLPDQEFRHNALSVTDDGIIYAGTLNGIVAFDPQTIHLDTAPSPLLVTQLSLRRGHETVSLMPDATSVTLAYDDRDLAIQIRETSFINAANNRYLFRLEGFDGDWVDAGHRGERVFSLLPPGRYVLKARAANADGVWTDLKSPITLHVTSPPWATSWAYAGYGMVVVFFGIISFRSYRGRIERRHRFAWMEEQRRSAEQLAEAKSTFLTTMSHEIRTPMTGVLGMTELLLSTPLNEQQLRYADAIRQSGDMMLRLVNDSLDLARIEAGKLALETHPLEPAVLLRDIAVLAMPMAERKGLTIDIKLSADIPARVMGDAHRLKQVLLNLVNNAFKFTEHGSITLSLLCVEGKRLRFLVADTGPGMSAEVCDRLFNRFEQADNNIAIRYGGSGLGLAICRDLVEMMNGHIEVQSTLGQGSVFAVELPVLEVGAGHVVTMPMDAAVMRPTIDVLKRSLRVLLVEDDPIVAAVISGLLVQLGHCCVHVGDALNALTELTRNDTDLVLLDLDLPGVSGLQLAQMIRAREKATHTQRLHLIAITARSGSNEELECYEAGMDDFLRKPVSGIMLDEKIMRMLSVC